MEAKELETLDAVIADLKRLHPEHPQHPVALAFGTQSVIDSAIDRLAILVETHRLVPPPPPPDPNAVVLTGDQQEAWDKLVAWSTNDKPYFSLRGFPGTGKTFLMQMLKKLHVTIFYSAPTNKATKVLSKAIKAKAKTIYSLLGLRMVQKDGELVMEYGKHPPFFPKGAIIVVDEASMVGSKLVAFIDKVRQDFGVKILYVGDPAQLNPVGERVSRSWSMATTPDCRAVLREVKRFDDQLLTLSQRIRECLKNKMWASPILDDSDPATGKGVHLLESQPRFIKQILTHTKPEDFTDTRVVVWRNKAVHHYNDLIRTNFGFRKRFCVGDLIMLDEPVLEDETIIAHKDDEFTVVEVSKGRITVDGVRIGTHQLRVKNEDQELLLQIPIKKTKLEGVLNERARLANNRTGRERAERWAEFWKIKAKFHEVRYAYAITSHRVQGTTLKTVYVDQTDILANRDKPEAFRSLMVACTRPTFAVYSY